MEALVELEVLEALDAAGALVELVAADELAGELELEASEAFAPVLAEALDPSALGALLSTPPTAPEAALSWEPPLKSVTYHPEPLS